METKKKSDFFIVFGLILFASFGFIAIATMDYQSYHEVSYPNNNLALPELTGKTEISSGVYRLYDLNGITLDYDINSGNYSMIGTPTANSFSMINFNLIGNETYTISYYKVSGTTNHILYSWYYANDLDIIFPNETYQTKTLSSYDSQIYAINGITYDIQFKLQISKGTYLLPYVVPKETIIYAHNQDYSALTEIGSVAITSLTAFINGFKVVGDILQTLVQFQQTVVYEISKFLIENYLKVIDFLESITDNGLIEWIKDPMKGFRF